jgi:hypothetical protein
MEKIARYRQFILDLYEEYAQIKPMNLQNVENQLIIDTERNHYQLVSLGWDGLMFVYSVIYHVDIKVDGKLWIQANNTDRDIAEELEWLGVPKSDIVLGLQPESYRPYTGYATA